MSLYMTIQAFAMEIQMSVDYLIQQFLNIGIIKTKFDFVTQSEKDVLLKHMRCHNIAVFNKFSLQRKTRSILNISGIGGKNKQVQVEVRKKHTYMVQSSTQNFESYVAADNLKDKNISVPSYKSTDVVKNKVIPSCKSSIKKIGLFTQTLKQDTQSISTMINVREKLNTQITYNCNEISKLNPKKYHVYDQENILPGENLTAFNDSLKNKSNDIDMLDGVVIKKGKGNSVKLESNHKNHSCVRLKYKIAGKTIKQKRNNNHRSYINSSSNKSYMEEKLCSINSRINKNKRKQSTLIQNFNKPVQTVSRDIIIGGSISVLELSNKMSVKSSYMIKIMMKLGLMVTINQIIDQETAQLVIEEMGHNAVLRCENELESLVMNCSNNDNVSIEEKDNNNVYKIRAPIVTVMGHVDHGKTSLLDCIRSANVASTESGGITQNIRSYRVHTKNGDMITFLDTPGHEAFYKMRMRGAQVTDIIVLVVAADDGVMPQTIESIHHIQSSNIPVIVAINKIDKLENNIDLIKHELNKYGLIPEEWGGNTQFINVSARSGFGIDNLLDAILLQSAVLDLRTVHYGMAKAIVIESFLDKGRGPVVIVLVREGELKCGDIILCGTEYGRVKAMRDESGNNIIVAGPSVPVELLGLSGIPNSGEVMLVVRDEKKAKDVALYRKSKCREIKLARRQEDYAVKHVFNNAHNVIKIPELSFIIKSDTKGSIEAICESLKKLSTDKISIKILFYSIGSITETDSMLALTSNSMILAFNVRVDVSARRVIELNRIKIYHYSVIYELISAVKRMIDNVLIPKYIYKIIGIAEVHNIFRSPQYGTIAGCIVTEGIIKLHKKVKIIRNNIIIHEGELESLRHFKNDVYEVKTGVECGIVVKNYHDIRSGDIIKALDKSEAVLC